MNGEGQIGERTMSSEALAQFMHNEHRIAAMSAQRRMGFKHGTALLTSDELASAGRQPTEVEQAEAFVSGYHVTWLASALLLVAGGVLLLALLRRRDVVAVAEGEAAAAVA